MLAADPVKDVLEGMDMPFVIGELDAIVHCPAMVCLQTMRGGQNDVDPVGHGGDQVAQKGRGGNFSGLLVQFHEGKLGRAVNGDEQIQFALGRLNRKRFETAVGLAG